MMSFAGLGSDAAYRSAYLFHPVRRRWNIGADFTLQQTRENITREGKGGFVPRGVRPYPVGPNGIRYTYHVESSTKEAPPYELNLGPDDLAAFLEKGRKDGTRPCSLAACVQDGDPRFSVVME